MLVASTKFMKIKRSAYKCLKGTTIGPGSSAFLLDDPHSRTQASIRMSEDLIWFVVIRYGSYKRFVDIKYWVV